MLPAGIVEALYSLAVPESVVADLPGLPDDTSGLLIYGSRARGDALPESDLDVLALVSAPRPSIHCGHVSVSFYTAAQLRSGLGTLFGAHLRRDAKVLFDTDGELRSIVEAMGHVEVGRLLGRARIMSQLFTTPEQDLPRYLPGLLREARYLLRSCLYAQAIGNGAPCFSVRELAARLEDPILAELLASRQSSPPSHSDLSECLKRLEPLVGGFPPSRHGSVEATVVNEWGSSSDLLSMAFLALGVTGRGQDYAEVEKILL